MPYDNPAVWANQNLFGNYLNQPAAQPPGTATATGAQPTPSNTFAIPGGPEFKTPTAAEIAANQNVYSNAALGNYQGLPVIQQQLKGQLPSDVQAQINQMGAERGVSTGRPGSPAANAATLRALGLTSLGMQQQGLQNLNAAYGTFPALNPFGISGENLAAWRTGTEYQAGALSQNAKAALQMEMQAIANNAAMTMQQKQMAMEQARNRAYAKAMQDLVNQTGQYGTTGTGYTGYTPTGTPGVPQFGGAGDYGYSPEDQDWMWNEGGGGLPPTSDQYMNELIDAGYDPINAAMISEGY